MQSDLGRTIERRYAAASDEARPRILRLAGRLAGSGLHTGLGELVTSGLASEDARTRRAAAQALGRIRGAPSEGALLAQLERETDATVRVRLIEALGKVGSERAARAIAEATRHLVGEASAFTGKRAQLMADRTAQRGEPSRIRVELPVHRAPLVLRCRAGLEDILASELPRAFGPRAAPPAFGPGAVEATLEGPLSSVFAARTFLRAGFALPPMTLSSEADLEGAIVHALTARATVALMRSLTEGPIRYRLAFAGAGKKRRTVWNAALAVSERAPALVNDPTESAWEVVVAGTAKLARLELFPNARDPRFAYRLDDVPAASHPTIAAALARVAEARATDVVWDPFVGSGGELAERSILGPYARMFGTDLETRALSAARANLERAGARAELVRADALTFEPPARPTAIITNPPMGRRVLRGTDVGAMLAAFVARAAKLLAPRGRLVWMSPEPRETRAAAERSGLSLTRAIRVDMGGFDAELQRFDAR